MKHTTQVTLVVENGKLHTKHSDISNRWMKMFFESNPLLLRISDEGDCESLRWPVKRSKRQTLATALYDARERGIIPNVPSVILPDGSEFFIEAELND